jgi:predicted flap endonuclease-1-like 5' DNA nuclease
MIGAVVFVIFFVLFLLISFVAPLPPAHAILDAIVPQIFEADPIYGQLAEGIINGVIYGVIIWAIFTIAKMLYARTQGPKEVVVKVEESMVMKEVSPRSAGVEDIKGIGPAYAQKLKDEGIKTTDDLLEAGSTKKGRKELAGKTGIAERMILEWVNKADLSRIKGIGEEYSDLLEEAGVDTVVELSRRNPENLHATIVGINEAKKLVQRTPTLSNIEDWVEQAKMLPRKVEY